ncbi:2112_t:CDS:1, partial [Funneliformis geosporum]
PAKLDKLTNMPIEKPIPTNTSHTIPKTIWIMPQLKKTLNH